jgi:hypothetical protein
MESINRLKRNVREISRIKNGSCFWITSQKASISVRMCSSVYDGKKIIMA